MSRIEQLIGEIEEYIDSCKYQPLSNSKILVNKEEMEELLVELRLRVPDEIKKYQKIISQQDAILADAKNQAESMIQDAKQQTEEMVSENEIMQQAYAKANELVQQAQAQADQILANATAESNNMKLNAIQYTDSILASIETLMSHSMVEQQSRYQALMENMQQTYDVVVSNRRELNTAVYQPETQQQETAEQQPVAPAQQDDAQ